MSLLMEYMPEYYTLDKNLAPNKIPNENKKTKSKTATSKTFSMFYILKNEINDQNFQQILYNSKYRAIENAQTERIRNDLYLLLEKNPDSFTPFNVTAEFSCFSKKIGYHRDPYDCTKFYYCSSSNANSSMRDVKSFACAQNQIFDMNGCFCNNKYSKSSCVSLSETLCEKNLLNL